MNTNKLKVMKFDESMENYEDRWTKAVDEEHEFMLENNVWHPMKVKDMSIGAKNTHLNLGVQTKGKQCQASKDEWARLQTGGWCAL